MAHSEKESDNEVQQPIWSEQYEHIPLKQRLKLLLASQRLRLDSDVKLESEIPVGHLNSTDLVAVKKEDEQCDSPDFGTGSDYSDYFDCSDQEETTERLSWEQSCSGDLRSLNDQETVADCMNSNQMISVLPTAQKFGSVDSVSLQHNACPALVKVECTDNGVLSSLGDCTKGSCTAGLQANKIRTQFPDDTLDELDHIVLKDRLRMLLSSKSLGLLATTPKYNSFGISSSVLKDRHLQRDGTGKAELIFGHEKLLSGNQFHEIGKTKKSGSLNGSAVKSSCKTIQWPVLEHPCQESKSSNVGDLPSIQRNMRIYSSQETFSKHEPNGGQIHLSGDCWNMPSSAKLNFAHIKVEASNNNDFENMFGASGHMPFDNMGPVKNEPEFPDDSLGDALDHMPLKLRMRLFSSREVPHLSNCRSSGWTSKMVPSNLDHRPVASEPAKPLKVNHPHKRRKTATDSVETAMEEDAPGLLQVLIEKGVSIGEIKLYSELESDDALDDSSSEANFAELKEIFSKLFSQRPTLLKLAPLRHAKGEKASYCLACLFSLVEQARYVQFRNWPVEWGWCRDLQSFIFVFERHNRIVLERPEYGYATYFFALEPSVPIVWQIKRLVTAMKLTSCSRVTLIENKAFMVGEDLSEGEVRVLMEYGWIPNTGLGTMLNYCDRVVHDRKNEKYSSEWKSKIGKLLIDGYNGGTVVSDMQRKLMDDDVDQAQKVKLELD